MKNLLGRVVCVVSLLGFVAGPSASLIPTAVAAEPKGDELSVGDEAPTFRLRTINADATKIQSIALDELVGQGQETDGEPDDTLPPKKKAVLLSFWASYCAPCKKELPFLTALQRAYEKEGLEVVSVGIDKEEPGLTQAAELIKSLPLAHPVVIDRYSVVAKRYGVSRLPALFLVNAEQRVVMTKTGYDDAAQKEIVVAVQKELKLSADKKTPEPLAQFLSAKPGAPNPKETLANKAGGAKSSVRLPAKGRQP